jgi:peroxiredoxin
MRFILTLCLLFSAGLLRAQEDPADQAQTTLVHVGDRAPAIAAKDQSGADWSLEAHKGKPVLVLFFATWCPPCLEELPHIEREIWQAHKDQGLVVVALGREHSVAEVADFGKKKGLSFTLLSDPSKANYLRYASKYIPRTFLVGRDGSIKFASVGWSEAEYVELQARIKAELAR